VVNQNHHTGWRSDAGDVVSHEGLLAVDLPSGAHRLTLRFLPRSAVGGALTTLAALIVAVLLWRRSPHLPRERLVALLLSAMPLAVAGASFGLIAEPSPPAATSRDDIDALLADAPPPGAVRLGVMLQDGVALEAVQSRWDTRQGEPVLVLELDWKLRAPPPPGLGFFVHVQPEGADKINADHPLVSDALALEDAPLGRTLRDTLVLGVPSKHRGKRWQIWAGLWRLHGDGSRVQVLDPGRGRVEDCRILAFEGVAPP
jgi:hypothetical protein